jgi:hypothetical protein
MLITGGLLRTGKTSLLLQVVGTFIVPMGVRQKTVTVYFLAVTLQKKPLTSSTLDVEHLTSAQVLEGMFGLRTVALASVIQTRVQLTATAIGLRRYYHALQEEF